MDDGADAFGGSGCDEVAAAKRGATRHGLQHLADREHHLARARLLPWCAVHGHRDLEVVAVDCVCRHHERAVGAERVERLAAQPRVLLVAIRPLQGAGCDVVDDRVARDERRCVGLGHVLAAFVARIGEAEHEPEFGFVVDTRLEPVGDHDVVAVRAQRVGQLREEDRLGRGLGAELARVLHVVLRDAQDFAWPRHGHREALRFTHHAGLLHTRHEVAHAQRALCEQCVHVERPEVVPARVVVAGARLKAADVDGVAGVETEPGGGLRQHGCESRCRASGERGSAVQRQRSSASSE